MTSRSRHKSKHKPRPKSKSRHKHRSKYGRRTLSGLAQSASGRLLSGLSKPVYKTGRYLSEIGAENLESDKVKMYKYIYTLYKLYFQSNHYDFFNKFWSLLKSISLDLFQSSDETEMSDPYAQDGSENDFTKKLRIALSSLGIYFPNSFKMGTI